MTPNTDIAPESLFDFSGIEHNQTYEALFGDVRALTQGHNATRQTFLTLCKHVESAALLNREATIEEMIPYIKDAVDSWPSRLKMAPLLWINRLILYALPVEALQLVSSLSYTAALCQWYSSTYNALLFDWLSQLPADAPALEGLTMSRSDRHFKALQKAKEREPEAQFHPQVDVAYLSVETTYFCDYESEQICLLLASPLTRHLRVLDISWDAIHKLVDSQDLAYGRTLSLGVICYQTNSDRLEVLDLHGQNMWPTDSVNIDAGEPHEVENAKRIKALNIGGGHPHGTKSVKALVKACPDLTWLNMSPGTLASFVFEPDFNWEEWQVHDANLIGVYDQSDIKAMTLTPAGKRALKTLSLDYLNEDSYSSWAGDLWAREFVL